MDQHTVNRIFDRFSSLQVLVIGDVMVDSYLQGPANRISPEAPVPVVTVEERENRLGGAANVALNVNALGGTPIICSVIGEDREGEEFKRLLQEKGISTSGLSSSSQRKTTIKTRVISNGQQMIRVDEEDLQELDVNEEKALIQSIKTHIDQKPDVVIFEDYNKGVLTSKVIEETIKTCKEKGIPTVVDPKLRNFFTYKGITLFKPNLKELKQGLDLQMKKPTREKLDEADRQLREKLGHEITLITLSAAGIYISVNEESLLLPAHIRTIADVSGAGDTVISVAAMCLALDLTPGMLAGLANLAGGLVCEQVGVVPVDKARLQQEALMVKETH